jgi:rare lipoprotein A
LVRFAAQARKGRGWSLCLAAFLAVGLAACTKRGPPPDPHYVLGRPYQAGGVWWYPRESQSLDETGLAAIYPDRHAPLTTDGERFSQDALAVAHPTLQLPAIARLANLETGRSLLVRINDRGSPTPHRLVQVTRRVAALLGIAREGAAQIRLTVLPTASAAAEEKVAGTPQLPIAVAPVGAVQAATLPPPSGARGAAAMAAPSAIPASIAAAAPAEPDGTVTQEAPRPGRLWVRLDTFQSYQYAAVQRAKLSGLSPRIVSVLDGRSESFRVQLGPFARVADADAALAQAIAAGVNDACIVVE